MDTEGLTSPSKDQKNDTTDQQSNVPSSYLISKAEQTSKPAIDHQPKNSCVSYHLRLVDIL